MARETESSRNKTEDGNQPDQTAQETPGAEESEEVAGGNDGFAQLREHHKTLRALLAECATTTDAEAAEDLLRRMAGAWSRHAEAHERLYDASNQAGLQEFPLLADIAVETDLVSFLLGRAGRNIEGPLELAVLRVAAKLIGGIIEREETPRGGLFAKAKAAGVDPAALGRRLGAGMTRPSDRDGETMPRLRHLTVNQEDMMPRNSNMPDRDERGRFVSDDDYGSRSGSGGRGSSGRYDDDRERDSRGRFMSDRDDDRGRSRSRDDDDRRYSRGRDDDRDRDYARSSRRDDDDRRSYSRGRDDDDDRGYSRDRSQGGWFGDSRGHSEAARLGWDNRRDDDDRRYSRGRDDDRDRDYARSSRRDDDDRRSYSRGRDDDDRSYSRDRGQGGWFGDSEGHAEAARRGWETRRDDDDDDRRYSSRGRR